jgi:DNA-binding NarL/FixJ family response regulator
MNEKKTVAIIDKSFVIRKGLAVLLNQLPHIRKIVELEEDVIIHNRLSAYNADIVIVNPLLLGSIRRKTVHEILSVSKKTKIVAFVYSYVDEQQLSMFDAVIYLNDTKERVEEQLRKIDKQENEDVDDENRELSEREKEILVGVVKGMINKEIAEVYNISINTVITHRRNIARKLDIHSPSGLTVYAILNKLVNIEDLKN